MAEKVDIERHDEDLGNSGRDVRYGLTKPQEITDDKRMDELAAGAIAAAPKGK